MAEDAILDKSWGDSPPNVFYRCAVKHHFNTSRKIKEQLPRPPSFRQPLCVMATRCKLHMASHTLLEDPLKRKSFKHSIRKGLLWNYKRSAKCEISESLKKERSKTYQPMHSVGAIFLVASSQTVPSLGISMETSLLFPIRGYEKYSAKLHYFSLLDDMNSLNTPFYPATGHVRSWKGEGKKKTIFTAAFSDFQLCSISEIPLPRCSAQTQISVRHAR